MNFSVLIYQPSTWYVHACIHPRIRNIRQIHFCETHPLSVFNDDDEMKADAVFGVGEKRGVVSGSK